MEGGLKITFDAALDGDAWPGAASGRSSTSGEAWYGPLGLLARLEIELGLAGLHASMTQRAVVLSRVLDATTGWWTESHRIDPIGTSRRLLRDRDLLMMWGWAGEPVSDRLDALWAVSAGVLGIPDRILDVIAAIPGGAPDIESIRLVEPPELLEPLWQRVLDALARRTTTISLDRPAPPIRTDHVTLVRPHGILAAANDIAAHLATLPSLDGVVIIGGDRVLDDALARHNLPRTGADTDVSSTALLRLVIEAAFEPMEPADLHAILCMDPGPIPRRVASPLIHALRRYPSRRAPEWSDALERGLARCDDDWRAEAAARIATLIMPIADRTAAIARSAIDARLALLGTWARSRANADRASLDALASCVDDARRIIGTDGAVTLVALRRLCDELDGRTITTVREAGLARVAQPGGVLAPARTIVWWNFTRASAPPPRRIRLSQLERDRLRALGLEPPDLGRMMESRAASWRRPVEHATETLLLVCPATTEGGDACFPHPMWDELHAGSETTHLDARRVSVPARSLPRPTVAITARHPIALREIESPSSIERLIACSLAWTLHYRGNLAGGNASPPVAPTPLLFGTLAHRLLEMVFAGGVLGADAAEARARAIVERELPRLCESLELPRYQAERSVVRRAIVQSARALGRLFEATGARSVAVERSVAGAFEGVAIAGRADMIVERPDLVIDLKWGKRAYADRLGAGTALQLALYAEMQAVPHAVAYFALQSQELLAPSESIVDGALTVGAIPIAATIAAARATLARRLAELGRGDLAAPVADGTEVADAVGESLSIRPACGYCSFGALCGVRRIA